MRLNNKLFNHFFLMLFLSIVSSASLLSFDAADLQEPADKAICQSIATEFTWTVNSPDRVMNYVIQVSAAQDFSTFIANQTIDTNAVTVDLPNFSSDYFWRVVTTYDDFTTEYSEERSFATETEPVTHIAPENNTTCHPQNVEFSWTESDASNTYEIWISRDINFVDTLYFEEVDTNVYVGFLDSFLTNYYWKVRSEFQNCKSEWSQAYSLTTAAEKPLAVSPENNSSSLSPALITLQWSANIQFQMYEVLFADNPNFANPQTFMSEDTLLIVTDLTLGTEYFWKVKGDTNSCWSDYSDVVSFWTSYPEPTLTSPTTDESCVDIAAVFDWDTVANTNAYEIQISFDDSFDSDAIYLQVDNIDTNSVQLDLNRSNYRYYWRVRAKDAKNTGLWSDIWDFRSALLTPTLTMPAQNETGVQKYITFEWTYFSTHDNYRFQLSKDSNFVDSLIVLDSLIGLSNSFDYVLDTFNTNYYWRLKAMNLGCESEWTETHTFRTSLGAPELTYPAHDEIDVVQNVLFRWTDVPLADSYTILVATDSLFENAVAEVRNIPVNNVQAAIFEPSSTLWWKVFAANEEGDGPWSEAYKFTTIIAGPAQPMLSSPEDNITKVDTTLTFTWFTTDGANSYELQVAERDAFVNLFAEVLDITDTTASVTGLKNNQHYYWRVRALNDSGYSKWSEPWKYRTIMKTPEGEVILATPADEAIDVLTTIKLEWSEVENALYYHVQVATDDQFTNMIYEKDNYWTNDYTLQGLDYSTTYFWRIKAYNEAGETEWSPTYSFTTESETSVADNQEFGGEISIYPNPAQTETTISFNLSTLSKVAVDVYDVNGSKVISIPSQTMHAGMQNINLDVNALVPGVYTYTILSNDKFIKGRFVVYR